MRLNFVHQGYELYGSDRCLIETVSAVVHGLRSTSVEVVLPRAGPIVAPLAATGAAVSVEPVFVLRKRGLAKLATVGLLRLVPALLRAARRFRSADLVYVNTAVVLDHLLVARFFPGKALVHVHESPPGATRAVLKALLAWSRAELVFNSCATRDAYGFGPERPAHVVYNGIAPPDHVEPPSYDGVRPLRLLMIGRINRDKGQDVLLDAVGSLAPALRERLQVRIVGSAFENEALESGLKARVLDEGLAGAVAILPFSEDPASLYRWSDIVAVLSKTQESLGRVAIEAMSHGRPVIASRVGGLPEVVEDGRTGWIVPPADPEALARALEAAIRDPESCTARGAAARIRYEGTFSDRVVAERIVGIVAAKLGLAAEFDLDVSALEVRA